MPTKGQQYAALVQARKACQCCASIGLKNPAHIRGGMFDSPEIGPWTRWNGDLDARLFVVGQDWGDVAGFERQQGLEDSTSGTNQTLRKLLHSVGISVSQASKSSSGSGVFLTNAVLCLKTGGAQAEVNKAWFTNCGPLFLRPQIELVRPRVVVSLGERAYLAIRDSFGLPRVSFQRAVNSHKPIPLPMGALFVAVYHCGQRILNTHRTLEQQFEDWRLVKRLLDEANNPTPK